MQHSFRDLVVQRIASDADLSSAAAVQVLRAFDSVAPPVGAADETVRGATLRRLEVSGFRGIGDTTVLELEPGPGLTLVIGRNGSGKSSLAEALEAVLRRNAKRFERSADWSTGWRNLHHDGPIRVRATFAAEGAAEPLQIEATWPSEAKKLEGGAWTVTLGQRDLGSLDAIGWPDLLDLYPPMLSYPELGKLFEDKPSLLYDAVAQILGIGTIALAMDAVRTEANGLRKAAKEADAERRALLDELMPLTDARAVAAGQALVASDLDELARLVAGHEELLAPELVRTLYRLQSAEQPQPQVLDAFAAGLAEVAEKRQELQGTQSERASTLVDLLDKALAYPSDGECPVCETREVLDAAWRARAAERMAEARQSARALTELVRSEQELRRGAHALISATFKSALDAWSALGLEVDPAPLRAWNDGLDAESLALAEHVRATGQAAIACVAAIQQAASARLEVLEATWRPLRNRLDGWLGQARDVHRDAAPLAALDEAEQWLKDAEDDLRDQRFAPIAQVARGVWARLRQESSVDLFDVALAGRRQRRKLDCQVTVDGETTNALAVMSQGELMALALGLFIPRMTMDESPFRFVVIDDPVQSMDPHKVDGLAQVLGDLARTRQVIVMTHDARLRNSLYRLGIPARVLEATRGERSSVALRAVAEPTEQYLEDARRVLQDAENLGDELIAQVVPTYCRQAFEAAFSTLIRRRDLGRGASHGQVEKVLSGARSGMRLAAIALCDDDRAREDQVAEALRQRCGETGLEAYLAVQGASHGTSAMEPLLVVRHTGRALKRLLEEAP